MATLNLKDIFERSIDRDINGVISAGSMDQLETEFSEYVVTNEVDRCLSHLFEYYNSPTPSYNGVWISGFFGSGKSHLLKILANLLQNTDVGGKPCLSFFENNSSCDKMLYCSIQKACSIKSESILFNIIQDSTVDKNGKADSILPTFIRQFNRHCGYYDSDPVIAEMERELDNAGLLDAFIEKFNSISGKNWKDARKSKALNRNSIIKAYAAVSNQSEDPNLLNNYNDVKLSISDFAERVNQYIQKKGSNFRLNFFVDEAGQFVVKDSRYMVELQEVATSLSDACQNKAWIFVTSQDELDKFVSGFGDKIVPDDVSKIMGRFYVKLKLTNENVNEVIQKRLLIKNSTGKNLTKAVYEAQKANFATLFQFVNGPKTFRVYKDEEEFCSSYPFITYQFDLFTVAFTALSNHHAFPGEYTSVGSRSMLDVFHNVTKALSSSDNVDVGVSLVPFDRFYDGIDGILMQNFKQSIMLAKNNLVDPFAIRVLKAMLLVKYIRNDFKTTPHNLSVLLLTSFTEDPQIVRQKTQDALNLLEAQTYIQRKGDEYEFLTNEEKDVEEEIKREDVNESSVREYIQKVVFAKILQSSTKLRSSNGKSTFNYSKLVDGNLYGTKSELGVNIISPFDADHSTAPIRYSNGTDLVMLLSDNGKLITDIKLFLQTESYYKKNVGDSSSEDRKKVLDSKRELNIQREKLIKSDVESYLSTAEYFVQGTPISFGTGSAESRFAEAGSQLIDKVYTNLKMLGNKNYNDALVLNAFDEHLSSKLFENLSEPEEQILSTLKIIKANSMITTPQALFDKFEKAPYGWDKMAVLYYLVMLKRKGKIEIKLNGKELSDTEIRNSITQTSNYQRIVFDVVTDVDPASKKKLSQYVHNISDKPCSAEDPKGIVEELKSTLNGYKSQMDSFDSFKFPFVRAFDVARQIINNCDGNSTAWFFNNFLDTDAEVLLEEIENKVKPCLEFLNSKERIDKYLDAKELLKKNPLDEKFNNLWEPIKEILDDPAVYRKTTVAKLPELCTKLNIAYSNELNDFRNSVTDEFDTYASSIINSEKYKNAEQNAKRDVMLEIQGIRNKFCSAEDRTQILYIQSYDFNASKAKINALLNPNVPQKPIKRVSGFKSVVAANIETTSDVEAFVNNLKKEMLSALDEGFIIQG